VLSEKRIPWDPVLVDLKRGEHRAPEFLSLNPNGKVPVLVDGDVLIYDSTIINEYLEEKFPDPPLTFSSPAERASVRMWEDYGDRFFLGPAEAIFIHQKGWRLFEAEKLDQFRREIRGCLERLEKQLQGREYLLDRFSLADIAFAPRMMALDQLEIAVPEPYGNLNRWIRRLGERESVARLER
jgi:glutathione S-transferase